MPHRTPKIRPLTHPPITGPIHQHRIQGQDLGIHGLQITTTDILGARMTSSQKHKSSARGPPHKQTSANNGDQQHREGPRPSSHISLQHTSTSERLGAQQALVEEIQPPRKYGKQTVRRNSGSTEPVSFPVSQSPRHPNISHGR